jgi:hypothetical protein
MIVAHGRSVQTGNNFRTEYTSMTVGGETKVVPCQVPVEGKFLFVDGEEVELTASEAARLLDLGFVIEPGAATQPRPLGITAARAGETPIGRVEVITADPNKIGLVSKQIY